MDSPLPQNFSLSREEHARGTARSDAPTVVPEGARSSGHFHDFPVLPCPTFARAASGGAGSGGLFTGKKECPGGAGSGGLFTGKKECSGGAGSGEPYLGMRLMNS